MLKERVASIRVLQSYRRLLKTAKKRVPEADPQLIRRAFRFSADAHCEQKRLSGEPYIIHPLAVATILAEQGLDMPAIIAALLHDVVEDTVYGEDTIALKFGTEVNALVKAVTKISIVKKSGLEGNARRNLSKEKEREADENIRLMLLATARDLRVILIKLADKLHNMRTLKYQKPEKIERIARETLNIYASIAGRLGMYRIKSELEDLAFCNLYPEENERIDLGLARSRAEQENFVKDISRIMKQRLAEISIKAKTEGRVKHNYSIYQKMELQRKSLSEIYDVRGIRIIVEDIRDCYGALGIVHTLWPPIQGRFKDYIATPKVNGYQSLHTTVIGPDGKALEIQIRTREMDEQADYGIAAHWLYKTDSSHIDPLRMRWLNRLSKITEDSKDTSEFIEDLRQELTPEEVYVFTPKGDIVDLPQGSTILDFAFHIHTEIGLHCRGGKVNERIVPLRTELKSGDRVEILTEKSAKPSPNWLRYICSPRTKQKLRAYFRKLREEEYHETQFPSQAIATTDRTKTDHHTVEKSPHALPQRNAELRIRRRKTANPKRVPIEVAGHTDIPVRYAGCCSPVPGDRIVGFVTRGRGVTIHRSDCPFLPPDSSERERLISVGWEGLTEKYPVLIEIYAKDRQGLYLDLVDGITHTYTNILKAEADSPHSDRGMMKARFLIEVEHADHLKDIRESLLALKGVISVNRVEKPILSNTTAKEKVSTNPNDAKRQHRLPQ